jgi:predicted glycoside hydrolase/deacetylase ChbG (UPF0249 family)
VAELRYLIVNADDFGLSAGTNRGIFQAHEHGIVTSASLMVRQQAAAQAIEEARRFHKLSLGLHLDLSEWSYRDGEWRQVYQVVPPADMVAVEAEILRQIELFRQLAGRDPTHLDSHQHVHNQQPMRAVFAKVARDLRLPLRNFNPNVSFCGEFYGRGKGDPFPEGITVENLCRIIGSLPAGITELGCHPGLDAGLDSDYCPERSEEVRTLCHSRVRAELDRERVTLVSFAELPLAG